MNRGDIFTVYMEGAALTLCLIGSYREDYSGEEVAILALVNQDDLMYIPVWELERIFPHRNQLH